MSNMNRYFKIDDSERKKILEQHKNFTFRKTLTEQSDDDFLDNSYVSPELSKGYKVVNEINLPDGEYVSIRSGNAAEIFSENDTPTGYLVITNKGTRSLGLKELVKISNKQLVGVDVYKILFKQP